MDGWIEMVLLDSRCVGFRDQEELLVTAHC